MYHVNRLPGSSADPYTVCSTESATSVENTIIESSDSRFDSISVFNPTSCPSVISPKKQTAGYARVFAGAICDRYVFDSQEHHIRQEQTLPPPLRGVIFLTSKDVFFQTIHICLNQCFIAHLPVESRMINGLIKHLFVFF